MIYEINFLVLQSKTEQLEKIRKETKKFLESFGAKVTEEKEYLKRKLAYEIQHENYGFFTVLRFEFEKVVSLDELKNKLNQKEEVARYIIVKAEDLPSLKEQDTKKLEELHTDKKSIKSEDVEKALKEQAKKEAVAKTTQPKKEKPVDKKVDEKEIIEKKEVVEDKETAEKKEVVDNKKVEKKEKPAKKSPQKKTAEEESEKEDQSEVSLDELDKKLDEILNS